MTREEVIKGLKVLRRDFSGYKPNEEMFDIAIKVLEQESRVIPQESKTGYWMMTNDYYTGAYGSIDYVECSYCHEYSLEQGNYCPNCGIKMKNRIIKDRE